MSIYIHNKNLDYILASIFIDRLTMRYNPRININELFSHPGFNRNEDDVWYYEDHSRNAAMIWNLMDDLISQEVVELFIKSEFDNFYPDVFTWLYNLYSDSNIQYHDIPTILKEKILYTFKYIRCYHGTRTQNIDLFLSHGIKPFNPNELNEIASELFIEYTPNLTVEIFQEVVRGAEEYKIARINGKENGVNLVLSQHILVLDGCSHYIESGSEYIQCIAGNLVKLGFKANDILSKIGTPFLLVCDIPLKLIRERALQNLVNQCLYDAFRELIEDMDDYIPRTGVVIETSVNPQYIKSTIEVPML